MVNGSCAPDVKDLEVLYRVNKSIIQSGDRQCSAFHVKIKILKVTWKETRS